MNDSILLESPTLRQRLCTESNTPILDRFGTLKTIPHLSGATLQQVASFYQVCTQTIKTLSYSHRKEMLADGYQILTKKDLQNFSDPSLTIPNRGLIFFSRRAILRLGMLLRDSPIARQVRSYLLDSEEVPLNFKEADPFKKTANQLVAQARLIAAMAETLSENQTAMRVLHEQDQQHEKRLKYVEQYLWGDLGDLQAPLLRTKSELSGKEVQELQKRVKAKGLNSQQLWKAFRKHFGISRYSLLPKTRYQEALDWIDSFNKTNR